MKIQLSDILVQIIAWVIIGLISLAIAYFKKRYAESKNWFTNNWMISAGVLLFGYALYQTYIFTQSIIATATILSFGFAIWLFILNFYNRSVRINISRNDYLEQNIGNKIIATTKTLQSNINEVKADLLMNEIKEWQAKGVEDNVITTCIRVLDFSSVESYNYEESLGILEEMIQQKKNKNRKNDVYILSEIRRCLGKIPEKYTDIVQKIQANL